MWRNVYRPFSSKRQFCILSSLQNMERLHLRLVEGEEKFTISLKYKRHSVPDKEINFQRSQNETLSVTLNRMQHSIMKKISKKKVKKKTGNGESDCSTETDTIAIALMKGLEPWDQSVNSITAWTCRDSLFLLGDTKYEICLNPPTVRAVKLPPQIMVGFSIIPVLDLEFADQTKSTFQWFRETHPVEHMSQVSNRKRRRSNSYETEVKYDLVQTGYIYTPTTTDIGKKIKLTCTPSDGERVGTPVECISKKTVEFGPENCPFEHRHNLTKMLCDRESFRVVSYNILADCYADSEYSRTYLFPQCPPEKLSMDYRKLLIVKEIQGYNGDIICLQEVDKKIFMSDLLPVMDDCGFEGNLCAKYKNQVGNGSENQEANGTSQQAAAQGKIEEEMAEVKPGDDEECEKEVESKIESNVKEGVATFFRKTKFRLLEQFDCNITDILKKDEEFWEKICTNESLKRSLEMRTSVLQVSLLENKDKPERKVLVANTHLFWHPRANNVRLLQALACVRHIQRILNTYKQQDISVVFCGDFNAHPLNALHELITKGRVKSTHADWYSAGKREFVEDMNVETSLTFTSACGYPQYTNYVPAFNGCLDYIYISSRLQTKQVIPLPSHQEVTELSALPNALFPSDHLALVCDLTWI